MIRRVKTGEWRPGYGKTIPAIFQPKNRDVIPLDFDEWDYFLRTIQIYGRFGPREQWPAEKTYSDWLKKRMEWMYNSRTMLTKGISTITKKVGGKKVISKKIKWIGNYYASGLFCDNFVNQRGSDGKISIISTISTAYAPNPHYTNPVACNYLFGFTNHVNWKNQPIMVSESFWSIWDGAVAPLLSRPGDVMEAYTKHLK